MSEAINRILEQAHRVHALYQAESSSVKRDCEFGNLQGLHFSQVTIATTASTERDIREAMAAYDEVNHLIATTMPGTTELEVKTGDR